MVAPARREAPAAPMRFRALLILVVLTAVVYRLLPHRRKEEVRDRLRRLGQAVVVSLVLYWIWLLAGLALGWWRSR